MTTLNHNASEDISSLITVIDRYADAGIDPAFDSDFEELERQFAEIRLTFSHS